MLPNKREKLLEKKQAEEFQQSGSFKVSPELVALSKLQPLIHQ